MDGPLRVGWWRRTLVSRWLSFVTVPQLKLPCTERSSGIDDGGTMLQMLKQFNPSPEYFGPETYHYLQVGCRLPSLTTPASCSRPRTSNAALALVGRPNLSCF